MSIKSTHVHTLRPTAMRNTLTAGCRGLQHLRKCGGGIGAKGGGWSHEVAQRIRGRIGNSKRCLEAQRWGTGVFIILQWYLGGYYLNLDLQMQSIHLLYTYLEKKWYCRELLFAEPVTCRYVELSHQSLCRCFKGFGSFYRFLWNLLSWLCWHRGPKAYW